MAKRDMATQADTLTREVAVQADFDAAEAEKTAAILRALQGEHILKEETELLNDNWPDGAFTNTTIEAKNFCQIRALAF